MLGAKTIITRRVRMMELFIVNLRKRKMRTRKMEIFRGGEFKTRMILLNSWLLITISLMLYLIPFPLSPFIINGYPYTSYGVQQK